MREVKLEFTNNSLKTSKIGKLNIDPLITPQGLMIHEKKNQTKKSHATVPLKRRISESLRFQEIATIETRSQGG